LTRLTCLLIIVVTTGRRLERLFGHGGAPLLVRMEGPNSESGRRPVPLLPARGPD
jgi:hypothetical protein